MIALLKDADLCDGLGTKKIGQGKTTYAKCPYVEKATPVELDVSCESDHE